MLLTIYNNDLLFKYIESNEKCKSFFCIVSRSKNKILNSARPKGSSVYFCTVDIYSFIHDESSILTPTISEQISIPNDENTIPKAYIKFVIGKVADILQTQGLPCCQCKQARYQLSRLSYSRKDYTAAFISERTGIASVNVISEAKQLNSWRVSDYTPEYRRTESIGKRPVLTPDEVLRLGLDEELIILRGQKALKAQKFDFTLHPESKKLIKRKASSHIPNWQKEATEEIDYSPAISKQRRT